MKWLVDLVIAAIGIPPVYYERTPCGAYDWLETDFVKDNNYHTLDLSGIVPEGTSCVSLHCKGKAASIGAAKLFRVSRDGSPQHGASCRLRPQVANVEIAMLFTCGVTTDRTIRYMRPETSDFTDLVMTVKGWWL